MPDHHRQRQDVLVGLRHRRHPRRGLRRAGRADRRPPVQPRDPGGRAILVPDAGGAQRPRARRRARAGARLRPAARGRAGKARHAAGQARPDLQPHRAFNCSSRRSARRARARCSSSAATCRRRAPSSSASSTRSSAPTTSNSSRLRSPPRSPSNAPLSLKGNKRVINELLAFDRLSEAERAGADRPAPLLLFQRGLQGGRAGLRREAQGRLEGPLRGFARVQCRWPTP